jgi:hypothetical protein
MPGSENVFFRISWVNSRSGCLCQQCDTAFGYYTLSVAVSLLFSITTVFWSKFVLNPENMKIAALSARK